MRRRLLPFTFAMIRSRSRIAALSLLLGALPACFSLKQPACAFTCVEPPHTCPENYMCGGDGLCHRDGTDGSCPVAAPEGGVSADGTNADGGTGAGAIDRGE